MQILSYGGGATARYSVFDVLMHLRKMGNKVWWWGGVDERWLVCGFEYKALVGLVWHVQVFGVTNSAW